MNELDKPYNPKECEDKIYKAWEDSGLFNPDNLPKSYTLKAKSFCIAMAPPNVTGSLHMGHALEYTLSDVLVRFKRMRGFETLWLPGTDHAGIATQNAVEKELKKQGLTRHNLGREKFLEKVWEWKEKYGHIIVDQLKKLGVSADWSRMRFTMDPEYQESVKTAFLHYYDKGWIYQGERVINWCSRCATSLSDLEIEYKEEETELIFIKYPLTGGSGHITVATVRSETMLGDAAVAVNPKDERYKKLIGQKVILPIQNREIPIVADESVDMEFGTGAVKVTPAHDVNDFEIAERHNLPIYKIIEENGRLNENSKICNGLKVGECREAVIKELENLGLIEKKEKYAHNIAKCYRCDTVIEPLLSKQWFLKMKELARTAADAVKNGQIKFHPENFAQTYLDWLNNIRDWTISRQIWWGHRLPVWFCAQNQTGRITNNQLPITNSKEVFIGEKPSKCPSCGECEMNQVDDVLDTWFSSALWPFATLGWPIARAQTKSLKLKAKSYSEPLRGSDLDKFYPTDLITNDRGIINLWDARMVFSGLEFMGTSPFKDIIVHATVLTKDGKRMSKSLGTGLDPLQLINEYGADAVRFALVWQAMGGQDIRWQQEAVVAGKKFLNKIWNSARFVLGRNGISNDQLPMTDKIPITKSQINKSMLEKLEQTKEEITRLIESYDFGQALHLLYDFFWHEFCDKYIETTKKLDDDETSETLLYVLAESLKLLHPFIPFITEALWGKITTRDKKLLIVEQW